MKAIHRTIYHCQTISREKNSCVGVFLGFFPVSVCPIGFYGIACNEICGNCRNVGQCHHITAACVSGCVAGYKGDTCKTREYYCN